MTTSMARVEANRRNCLKSTGPKTEAGKVASRLNAFRHGLAGAGDLLGPGEDGAVVARRAEAFGRELGASGATGMVFAHRAALLSVRMESLAKGEMIAVHAAEVAGREAFDADRAGAIDELLAEAKVPGDEPRGALEALEASPDGLHRLIVAWDEVLAGLGASDPGEAREVAARWLGLDPTSGHVPDLTEELARRGAVEVDRLRAKVATMAAEIHAIERARRDAGVLARFDPSPEATLARRYEAAAERGMYRAIRAIAAINRQGGRAGDASKLAAEAKESLELVGESSTKGKPSTPSPMPAPPPPDRIADASLASFRAGVDRDVDFVPIRSANADSPSFEGKKKRPDLRKIHQKLGGGRR